VNQLALPLQRPRLKASAWPVLAALVHAGEATAWDLMAHLGPHAQRSVVARRLLDIERAGYAERVGTRRSPTGVRGATEIVYAATPAGRDADRRA
jgi:hypothetical protein